MEPLQDQIIQDQQEIMEHHVEQSVPEEVSESPEKFEESQQEKNWKEIRNALKDLKKENQYLRQQALQAQQTQKQPTQPDPDDDEPYVTPRKLEKRIHDLETQLKAKDAESVEDRLRYKYSDYDEVVSTDNVEYLQQHDPELVMSIQRLSDDPYKQATAAYKLLKKTDYYMNKGSVEDKNKAENNSRKPVSVQSVRKQGVLSETNRFANGLTNDLKKSLWKEMQQARKSG